jgi:hypothetical protein
MTRFLDLASKALAVVGVLTLMYTASVTQEAKAQAPPPPKCKVVPVVIDGDPRPFITCNGKDCTVPLACKLNITPSFVNGQWTCCTFLGL